ncbi:hypothetical protein EVAR_88507_1 [Eumeta japonica]|uniref:Uncharacterized protein n=1 Tax=Eumeta variegata TaxID=151549 RepID=A0A4C1XVX6_EUMVA|nr:hypothetical protein EVAR_88507_1 [Eumeta japonica]
MCISSERSFEETAAPTHLKAHAQSGDKKRGPACGNERAAPRAAPSDGRGAVVVPEKGSCTPHGRGKAPRGRRRSAPSAGPRRKGPHTLRRKRRDGNGATVRREQTTVSQVSRESHARLTWLQHENGPAKSQTFTEYRREVAAFAVAFRPVFYFFRDRQRTNRCLWSYERPGVAFVLAPQRPRGVGCAQAFNFTTRQFRRSATTARGTVTPLSYYTILNNTESYEPPPDPTYIRYDLYEQK